MSAETVAVRADRLAQVFAGQMRERGIAVSDAAFVYHLALFLRDVEDDALDRAKRAIVKKAREGLHRLDFAKPLSVAVMLLELDELGGKTFVQGGP